MSRVQSFASQRLAAIAKELRAAGERDIRLALNRGIRAGARPLVGQVRAAAEAQLPKRGGLNKYEASQRIRIAIPTGSRSAGVRIVGKASRATDTGTWRHPDPSMLGYDRSYWKWSEQTYPAAAGWWTKTLERGSPAVVVLINAELNRVGRMIQAGL